MAVSERLFVCLVALLGGCSLITDASDHQDGVEADGGPSDAGMPDAGDVEDMFVADDMGGGSDDMGISTDMNVSSDMGVGCGVADLNGGSLVASGLEAYDVTDFTIEVWIRPDAGSLSGNRNVFGRWGRNGESGSYALFLASGQPSLALSCNGSDTNTYSATSTLDAGAWVHIAGTFQASDRRVQLFVDGARVVDDTAPLDCLPNPLGTEADLVLGYDDPAGGNPAEGLVDEARLSRVLRYTDNFTPERFFTDPPDADTVALYHFEDAMLPATDASSNENSMSAEGAAELTTACRP